MAERRVGLVVASNRGPLSVSSTAGGRIIAGHAGGGVAPSLARGALEGADAVWVAAAMNDAERRAAGGQIPVRTSGGVEVRLVDVTEELIASAYRVIANGTLWPLLHGLFDATYRPVLDRRWHEAWAGYRAYNAAFAGEIARVADHGATVVVNDYHLAALRCRAREEPPRLANDSLLAHAVLRSRGTRRVANADPTRAAPRALRCTGRPHSTPTVGRNPSSVASRTRSITGVHVAVIPLGVDAEELSRIVDTDEVARSVTTSSRTSKGDD